MTVSSAVPRESAGQPVSDREIADGLDALARQAEAVRRMIGRMTLAQLDALASTSQVDELTRDNVFIDLEIWAVVAAAHFRGLDAVEVA